jgi:hypothetical protein
VRRRHAGQAACWSTTRGPSGPSKVAYYQENTEGGLCDYLALLSVCETCRYKGVSFFRFLLSGLRDIDAYCRRRSSRRRFPAIQVYPKGLIPPHFLTLHKRPAPEGAGERQGEGDSPR